MRPDRHLRMRVLAAATGATLGVGLGLMLAEGHPAASLVTLAALALLVVLTRMLIPPDQRRMAIMILVAAFALRAALAVGIFVVADALGRRGFITGDDSTYADLAWNWLLYVRGDPQPPWVPPDWNQNLYLFGVYTYFVAAIFTLVGHDAVAVEVVNAAMATASCVLVYDLCRRLFDRRAAMLTLIVLAFLPSAALWSSLNLKDGPVFLLIAVMLWGIERMRSQPTLRLGALMVVAFLLLRGLRSYVFADFAIVVPIAAFTIADVRRRRRFGTIATAISLVSVVIFGVPGISNDVLTNLESIRYGMAFNARTGYYEPPPVVVQNGDVFRITTAVPDVLISATPAPTPSGPTPTPRVIVVQPGTRLVLGSPTSAPSTTPPTPTPARTATSTSPTPTPSASATASAAQPAVVVVQPGDIVVVGPPQQSALPQQSPRDLVLSDRRTTPSAQLESPSYESDSLVLNRTLSHIPVGFAYALLAPFPWAIQRPADLATVPEVLLWYLCVMAGLATLWSRRSDWRRLLPSLLFICILFGVFIMVEANTGTLFRHRSMLLTVAVVLASPTLIALGSRLRARAAALRPVRSA